MKTAVSVSILFLFINFGFSQIKISDKKPNLDKPKAVYFDSTKNFLGENVYGYINQELYLRGKPESLREFGYEDFTNYLPNKRDRESIAYIVLAEKYFTTLDVTPAKDDGWDYDSHYYLKLKEKESGDIYYYRYDFTSEISFPFVSVGYFTKQKAEIIGKEYLFKKIPDRSHTGNYKLISGSIWRAEDIIIEGKYHSLVVLLKNSDNEEVFFPLDERFYDPYYIMSKTSADSFKEKFGQELWKLILDSKLSLGMTQEMVEIAWGKPKDINRSIYSDGIHEQWVYYSTYLYFENGILTAAN